MDPKHPASFSDVRRLQHDVEGRLRDVMGRVTRAKTRLLQESRDVRERGM